MAFNMSFMPGGLPPELKQQNDWQTRLGGLLSGDNALFNLGIGILANNNSNNLSEVLGRGVQQGLQQTQQVKQLGLQNKRLEAQERRFARQDRQLDAEEQAHRDFDAKFPDMKGLSRISPTVAAKLSYPQAADPLEYGLVPQVGTDPTTGQQRYFIQSKDGSTKWLDAAVPPKPQFVAPTEYTPGYFVDPRNPNAPPIPIQTPAQPSMGGYGESPMPQRVDPRAPWANLQSPKQVDEAKQRTYQDASKYIAEIDASVKNYGDTQAQLDRFLELNRKQATGSYADRFGLPSLDSDKREMEALQAQLAPKVREPGSGTTSDRDIGLYLQGLPGVDKTGDVNANLVNMSKKAYQKALEKQSFYNAYLQEYGHLSGAAELFERDYALNHPKEKSGIKDKPKTETKKSTISTGGWSATKVK